MFTLRINDEMIKKISSGKAGRTAKNQIDKINNTSTAVHWYNYINRIGAEIVEVAAVIAGTDNVIKLSIKATDLPKIATVYLEDKSDSKKAHDKNTKAQKHGRIRMSKKIASALAFIATEGKMPEDTGCTIDDLKAGQLYLKTNIGKGFEEVEGGCSPRGVDKPETKTELKAWNGQFELGKEINNDQK